MAEPMLRFAGGPADKLVVAWSGPWPPPDEMLFTVGKQTGGAAFSQRSILEEKGIDVAELLTVLDVFAYRRVSFSRLPAEVDELPHVARCADFEFAEQWS